MSTKKSASPDLSFVGLDVHKDSITSAVLEPGREVPIVDRFFHDEASIRRFVASFENRAQLRTCYEAGPTGYELARLLQRLGVACEVIAPSLIPVAPGAKVKTDSRDARRIVHLYRAGRASRFTSRRRRRRPSATLPANAPISSWTARGRGIASRSSFSATARSSAPATSGR